MSRFQGERSRWVDMLIGAVAVLLIAGFAYMLLGNRQSTQPISTVPQQVETSPEIPAAPGSEPEAPAVAAANENDNAVIATEVEELPEDHDLESPNEFNNDEFDDSELETEIVPAPVIDIPSAPADADDPASASESTLPPTATSETNSGDADDAGSAPPTSSVLPRAGGAVPTSAGRVPTRSEYRISLGGFGSSSQAVQRTAAVAGLGYTVYSIDLGDQVVAQVGPFANAAQAQEALADIQRVYPAAAIFAPKAGATPPPTTAPVQDTAPAQRSPAQSSPAPARNTPPAAEKPKLTPKPQPTPKPTSQPTPKPTPTAETYLQVGAFEDFEKAQELVETLQSQGFSPSVNAPEGQMAKVLIGPFGPDELSAAEARLDASGYDHFRVR